MAAVEAVVLDSPQYSDSATDYDWHGDAQVSVSDPEDYDPGRWNLH